jgi:hypothetical protein
MVARVHETIDVFTAHVVRLHLCGCLVQYQGADSATVPTLVAALTEWRIQIEENDKEEWRSDKHALHERVRKRERHDGLKDVLKGSQ